MTNNSFKTKQSMDAEPVKRLRLKHRVRIRIRKSMLQKRGFLLPLIVCFILLIAMTATSLLPAYAVVDDINPADYPNDHIQLSFVGDVMLGRYIETYGEKYGYSHFFDGVSDVWQNSDYVIANLECSVVLGDKRYYEKALKNIHISATKNAVDAMAASGINAITYANNHCLDYGPDAYKSAVAYFDSIGLANTGNLLKVDERQEKIACTKLTANGKSIGFIGVNDTFFEGMGSYGSILTSHNLSLFQYVNNAATDNDLTIVYIHWGKEYVTAVDADQIELAHQLIDAGADIIIGSHPHCLQSVEKYGNGIIFYSLGNFIMDQNNTFTRDSVIVQYNEAEDGRSYFELIPVRLTDGRPAVTSSAFYKSRIRTELTSMLAENDYIIDSDGHIIIEF